MFWSNNIRSWSLTLIPRLTVPVTYTANRKLPKREIVWAIGYTRGMTGKLKKSVCVLIGILSNLHNKHNQKQLALLHSLSIYTEQTYLIMILPSSEYLPFVR